MNKLQQANAKRMREEVMPDSVNVRVHRALGREAAYLPIDTGYGPGPGGSGGGHAWQDVEGRYGLPRYDEDPAAALWALEEYTEAESLVFNILRFRKRSGDLVYTVDIGIASATKEKLPAAICAAILTHHGMKSCLPT